MIFKNYKIELNDNYYPAHPESKYIFYCIDDPEQPGSCGATVEECIDTINLILENYE